MWVETMSDSDVNNCEPLKTYARFSFMGIGQMGGKGVSRFERAIGAQGIDRT